MSAEAEHDKYSAKAEAIWRRRIAIIYEYPNPIFNNELFNIRLFFNTPYGKWPHLVKVGYREKVELYYPAYIRFKRKRDCYKKFPLILHYRIG